MREIGCSPGRRNAIRVKPLTLYYSKIWKLKPKGYPSAIRGGGRRTILEIYSDPETMKFMGRAQRDSAAHRRLLRPLRFWFMQQIDGDVMEELSYLIDRPYWKQGYASLSSPRYLTGLLSGPVARRSISASVAVEPSPSEARESTPLAVARSIADCRVAPFKIP